VQKSSKQKLVELGDISILSIQKLGCTFSNIHVTGGLIEEVDGVMDMEASGKLNFAVRLWLTEAGTPGRWSLVQGIFHRDFS